MSSRGGKKTGTKTTSPEKEPDADLEDTATEPSSDVEDSNPDKQV
jgi:hypothetical protein